MKEVKKQFNDLHNEKRTKHFDIGCSYDNEQYIKSIDFEKVKKSMSSFGTRSSVVLEDYIPDKSKPITFICININIFQDSSGRGSFQKEDISRLKQIIHWINGRFAFNYPKNYSPIYNPKPQLPKKIDSRVRLVINRIEFYKDDVLNKSHSDSLLLNAIFQRDLDMKNQLNFVITNPSSTGHTGHAIFPSTNINHDQGVFLHGSRDSSDIPEAWSPVGDWFLSLHWMHELGHIFGLCHTYDPAPSWSLCGRCNEGHQFYLYDIHGLTPNKNCPIYQNSGNNNIMAGGPTEEISTLQIAKIHYAIENYSIGKYTKGCCCNKCVAFGANIFRHKSQGDGKVLEYEKTLANVPWAWDGKIFTCPSDGIYNFSISFQKDSLIDGGTHKDVWIKLWADWELIGTAWSEQAGSNRGWFQRPSIGRRDSVCFTTNIKLKKGTIIKTEVGSHNNEKRHLVDVNFSGHLLCSDCC